MAGILDFLGGAPQGGILGSGLPNATPNWVNSLGIFGAALKDAGASLNGRDSNSAAQFQDFMRQNQLRQAYALAANGDPSQRPQAYAAILAGGGDPSALQHAQAQQALPQLLQNLQPSEGFNDNPVGVTPAVNASGPGVDAARAAALQTNAAPAMSMQPSTLSGALQRTGSPELTAEMAPQLIQNQLASQTKLADAKALGQLDAYTPIPQGDPAYAGYRKGTILGRNQVGDIKPLQQSDIMSPEAEAQKERIARVERSAAIEAQMRMYGMTPGSDPSQNPQVQSYVKNILAGNMNMQNVPQPLRGSVSVAMANAPKEMYSPIAASRNTMAASRITKPYTEQSGYKLTADAVPYLARINAAIKTLGSVSDQDILDSLTKLNTGGNAVTDAQIKLITDGKSFSDWAGVLKNKVGNGGVLSDNQRQQIQEIAGNIYQNYRKTYQPIYDAASAQLTDAGIPKSFWTIPDLNSIGDAQMGTMGLPNPSAKPTQPAALAPSPASLPRKNKTIRFEDLP